MKKQQYKVCYVSGNPELPETDSIGSIRIYDTKEEALTDFYARVVWDVAFKTMVMPEIAIGYDEKLVLYELDSYGFWEEILSYKDGLFSLRYYPDNPAKAEEFLKVKEQIKNEFQG